jgi:hypothetical protein
VENKMSHLPRTDSISELAAFWQAHDLTDFEDELIEANKPVFQRIEQLSIQLAAQDISALRTRARHEHVSEADLIARWVHERLSGKEESPTSR